MIINRISDKNNSKIIAEKYAQWLNSGINPSKILVLSFNSSSKKNILKNILNLTKKNILSDMKIYTVRGLIYNTVLNDWTYLENKINNRGAVIIPKLTGLEISQYLLKQILKQNEVKGYNSKKSLLHQLFRRYSLIVNNDLSANEVENRSKILGESFAKDASEIIKKFQAKTIDLRSFDYTRQAQIFTHIFKNTDYFKNIEYLILEDADECTPLIFDFLESLAPNLKDSLILTDTEGGTRCGYLCAEPNAKERLEKIFGEKIEEIEENPNISNLKQNIFDDKTNILTNIKRYSLSKRIDMIEYAITEINKLIESGINPSDISIVTPVQDKMLRYTLNSGLKNCSPIFLTGNDKLSDNVLVKAILTLLKLSINVPVDEYNLRILLSDYLDIPVKSCKSVFEYYAKEGKLPSDIQNDYSVVYKKFYDYTEKLRACALSLSEKAYHSYTRLNGNFSTDDIKNFNFFLKELQDFEKVFGAEYANSHEEDIITQIENSIISENPYSTLDIEKDNLIISTPQMIIDNKIKTKYQFWLDTTSNEWLKSDIGPLYNSWVFQKSWDKTEYTVEDNIRLSKTKIFKILRKLMLNADNIISLSSLFDTQGIDNFEGIEKYLITADTPQVKEKERFKIIPRDDQKPVLEYKKGNMAISAVPGAGKTTILLALVIELINKGINPENIYVLTYMESASRNFKDRIKSANPDNIKLPNISTIHGLALRILKENSNYSRLGLDDNFDICDDSQRANIIKAISSKVSKNDLEDFDRTISTLKFSGADLNPENNAEIKRLLKLTKGSYNDVKLSKFLRFFYNYQSVLSENNLIDYDDILILTVKLLENNPDILEHYQKQCEYIIEDEAQDSSPVQQKMITMLSGKYKNLIRCGDINQAITTTFTNADVEGFKRFIETSNRVNMNKSQRCSKGVWTLANDLVKYGNSTDIKPFYEIFMAPVEGKNPKEKYPIHSKIFDTDSGEKIEVVKTIKSLLSKTPDCTIGILLRNNYQVNRLADYVNNSGLTAITRNECLGQKNIFRVIFSILKFISNPYDNVIISNAYKSMADCGMLKPHMEKIIEDYPIDFITEDNDAIKDGDLSRFHWDMNYWLTFPELTIDELALKIGLNYFSKPIEKSNIFLIATLCAKLNTGTFAQTIQKLEELSQRPNLSGYKFFSEEDETKDLTAGKIQIMTLHKSKGDEFDYVFLPEMTDKNMSLDIDKFKLKKNADFTENVKGLNKNYKSKTDKELKKFLISENYRLLYVAITRAKRRLYVSTAEKEYFRGVKRKIEPSIIFETLLSKDTD